MNLSGPSPAEFTNHRVEAYYRWILLASGIILLLISTLLVPPRVSHIGPGALLALFAVLLILFPITNRGWETNLLHVVILGGGLLYGPATAGWVLTSALFGGWLFHKSGLAGRVMQTGTTQGPHVLAGPVRFGFNFGSILIALNAALFSMDWRSGIGTEPVQALAFWPGPVAALLIFPSLHAWLCLVDIWLSGSRQLFSTSRDLLWIGLIEFLPVPFIWICVLSYSQAGLGSVFVLGSIPVVFSVLVQRMNQANLHLTRRIQELSTLHQISQVLRSSLDLDHLLTFIQLQLSRHLEVDNFYVALLEADEQHIWYPLAYKQGGRRYWAPRPLTDRLTDRVIRHRQPILLPRNAQKEILRIGLPSSEDPPNAWMGVPLVAMDRSIGCLAVFSLRPEAEFTQEDLELLSILSSQLSVAIENISLGERVKRYAAHSAEQGNLATVLDSVKEGILVVEEGGRITLANEILQSLTGLPRPEFLRSRFDRLSPSVLSALGFTSDEASQLVRSVEQGQSFASSRLTFRIPDADTIRVLERYSSPVWGPDGQPAGWMLVLRDVTEQYLQAQSRELITETLVHDLRSPVSAVMGALDMMAEVMGRGTGGADNLSAEALLIARRSTQRLFGLIDNLLDIARLQSGRVETTQVSVALATIVNNVFNEFMPQSHEYGIGLRKEIPSDLPNVRADMSKITRVLNNLIDNALKYSPPSGEVLVSASVFEEWMVAVQVSDRGPGIPEEYRSRIFERFTQVPGQRGKRKGTGLGLTFCKLAVEAHGGKIWVEPNPEGGSNFIFTLPLADPFGRL